MEKNEISSVFSKHQITVDDMVECYKRGINAKKLVRDDMGVLTETDDMIVQHKFFATGMELLGYLKGNGTQITNIVKNESQKRIDAAFEVDV